jgi:hypothetical protein
MVHHLPGISQPMQMWKMPQSDQFIQEPEYRSLEFFQLHTTLCFGRDIGLYLLQAAYHEPIIRTIAVAIGSLHRSFVHNDKGLLTTREQTRFTLQHYNKAIRKLVAIDSQHSPQANDTFLIACILFYCFECLQGHYRSAVQHGTSGLRIIKQQQMLATGQNFPRYMPRETVALLFAMLESQILEIEGEVSFADELRPVFFSSFHTPAFSPFHPPSNIEEMETWLELLYNKFTRFENTCEALREQLDGQEFEFIAHIQHLQEKHFQVRADLEAWILVFESWLDAGGAEHSEQPHSVLILKIWKVLISITLRLELPHSELSWDQHLDDFALMISFVSDFLGLPPSPKTDSGSLSRDPTHPLMDKAGSSLPTLRPRPSKTLVSTFSISLGIVTPLFLCATRCRDSSIRHRAIDILSTCQRREGLWDSELAGRVTRRIAAIEEAAAGIQPGVRYTCSDIGEDARLSSFTPQYGQGREIKIRYNWARGGTSLIEETFTW